MKRFRVVGGISVGVLFLALAVTPSDAAEILIMNQPGRPFDDDLVAHLDKLAKTIVASVDTFDDPPTARGPFLFGRFCNQGGKQCRTQVQFVLPFVGKPLCG